jgi:preprotein translocase subunit SecD
MAIIDYLKDHRILFLLLLVLILAVLDIIHGIHLGTEFIGGTDIPITLEHSVSSAEMSSIVSILQQRLSKFGLGEVNIQPIGNSQIQVVIPRASQSEIESTIGIIESQGIFQGVIDGKVALTGQSLVSGSIGGTTNQNASSTDWSVSFYITQGAAQSFSKAAFGQGGKPIYMFLDRPSAAVLILNSSILNISPAAGITSADRLSAIQNATLLGAQTIPIKISSPSYSNFNSILSYLETSRSKYSIVLLESSAPTWVSENIIALNYTITYITPANMTPQYYTTSNPQNPLSPGGIILTSWPAIGLLDAPLLSQSLGNGSISQGYTITGSIASNLTGTSASAAAQTQEKDIESVLSGGALPVHVVVGIPYTTPPTLGQHFEFVSIIALLTAVVAVAFVITIRYKKIFLIGPILLTTLSELFIVLSIIGLAGNIDLATIAGMIAVVGTGVDAQIIISDEILGKHKEDHQNTRIKLNSAFYVIWVDAILLVIAMLPLFFSTSLFSVTGFSESTIFGALLGAFITRPAYGSILSRHFSSKESNK